MTVFVAPAPLDYSRTGSPPRILDRLTVFTFLWSGYLLLHQANIYFSWFQFTDIRRLVVGTLVFVLAGAAVLRPSSVWRFSALLAVLCFRYLRDMPHHANHSLLTMFICITMLAVILRHAIKGRGNIIRPAIYAEMAALVALELITLYFFVVLHKLNYDYFNPAVSCGAVLYQQITEDFPFLPTGQWVRLPGIIGALIFEASIPILLSIRRTRMIGILVGMLFHLLLSLHENLFIYDFSLMLYGLYFLFLPDELFVILRDRWQNTRIRAIAGRWLGGWRTILFLLVVSVTVVMTLAVGSLAMTGGVSRDGLIDALHVIAPRVLRALWFSIAALALWAILWALKKRPRQLQFTTDAPHPPLSLFRPALSPLLVLPVIVFLNGLCPYAGLKTESSFAMYANLCTENGQTNHLFMPARFRVAGYQEDVVEIVDSTDGYLRSLKEERMGLTYHDFRRRLSRVRDASFSVTYRRGGETRTLTKADDGGNKAFQPPAFLERKLLHFRPIQMDGQPQRCGH